MKLNTLDVSGFYIVDHLEGPLPENWTSDLAGDGYYKAQYQGAIKNDETGEWTAGKWVETSGPSPEDIKSARELLIVAETSEKTALMSHASDMIGAITDEIEGLEDSDDIVPDKLRTDLKAWKQYRVKVMRVDTSKAPGVEWPESPE